MSSSPSPESASVRVGTWTALVNPLFRNFWAFSFLAFAGASMQSVGAGWLMTQLDPSPSMVSLVQAAFSLSAFLMALPAGVIADLVDRKWVMLGALACLMGFAGLLGIVTMTGHITPGSLILLTFLFGLSAATMTPAMQATTPDLVPRVHLPSALTLNGLNNSVARALGPGVAGLLLGLWGAGWMFILDVFTFIGLFAVIAVWRERPAVVTREPTRFLRAMLDGMHFSASQPPLRRLLIKMVLNFLMVSILLALIPSVVEQRMDGQPQTLGLLLACFGIGSVVGSLTLSRMYARFSRSRVIDVATFGHAIAVLIIGLSSERSWSAAAMLLAGLSWTSMMTSVNIVAQMLLPARMRARGLSINMMAMMGSLALGAAIWGQVAEAFGLGNAFLCAAIGGLLMPILTSRMHLVEELPETLAAAPAAGPASGEN